MSSQYLLAKMALVYTPEAEDGDIERGLTEGENGDNDLTDTFAYFSFVLVDCQLAFFCLDFTNLALISDTPPRRMSVYPFLFPDPIGLSLSGQVPSSTVLYYLSRKGARANQDQTSL
ncbi:hypothetical protein C349_05386 [Cryptococcus neoformans var. grubii Br795]|uniref:Uncharacterized protein n=1 Tax=Cryptococcus neoformans Tu259-1 TaxID=1230072 RepID=A0A854Q4S4_CRYNE|nr:hypothetical protein C353_05349 [Cryptococcus neoformans var. grubii AD1-83a]OWZ51595.1 hypothetical protein C368_05615 [Cryptococcus neoformans var. grubii 125.91]OXG14368.1 hypothetical protein C361_05668 [Cryptococcus neoformans var. grubii Tu259-1]OXG46817.1 hypothetical protein C355_05317 [Cryptococcus neoformans var. grubii Th84]OXG51882.1 hypothetical protein C354_05291 [Cryptococcus neoformans var. grubii MW-RSA1955]OXG55832.1 hypothetical protein C352_05273 [Cryptococcus neoformans